MKKHEIPLEEFEQVFNECLYYFDGHIWLSIVCHKSLPQILQHISETGEFPENILNDCPGRLDFPELKEFSREAHESINKRKARRHQKHSSPNFDEKTAVLKATETDK